MGSISLTVTFALLSVSVFYPQKCLATPTLDLVESPAGKFLKANIVPRYFEGLLLDQMAGNSSYLNGLSPMCRKHYVGWLTEIQNNYNDLAKAENWALQMMDAWGKPPEGLLSGHVTSMGDFDECLDIRGHISKDSKFKGKYCTNYLIFPVSNSAPLSPLLGNGDRRSISELMALLDVMTKSETQINPSVASCLPSTCSDQDVLIIIQAVFSSSEFVNDVKLVTGTCSTDDKPPLSAGSIAMIVLLLLLLTLCIVGSTIDITERYGYSRHPNGRGVIGRMGKFGKVSKVLLAFSIPKNTQKLLSTTTPPGNLGCLHGIRFLSATWVILGHTFFMHVLQPLWNLIDVAQAPQDNLLTLVIVNGGVVVDTFLTVSGMLVAFNILKALDKSNGKLNVPLLYLNRYLRLTPIYALVIGLGATLFPYLSSGPNWFVVDAWAQFCQKNWWKNLLYINNLPIYDDSSPDSMDKLCYGESWYLGAEMQLFILSPFFVYPLWRWKRVGVFILAVATSISIIVPFTKTYVDNLLPTSLPFRAKGNFTHQSYMATWMRASPYVMGLWTGYFLYKTRRLIKIPRFILVACWSIAVSSAFAVLLGIQKYYNWRYEIPRLEGAIYAGFHHAIWGICIGWLMFACIRGYGGRVNDFLSMKVFIPLGRLTYAIYLVSFHLQFLLHFSYRQPIYFSVYNAVNISFSHLVMCCIVAFIFSVTMESPFMELEKMVLRKEDSETRETPRLNDSDIHRSYGTRNVESGPPKPSGSGTR